MSTVKKPLVIGGKLKLKGSSSSASSTAKVASNSSTSSSTNTGMGSLPNSSAAITGKKRPLEITPDDVIKGDVEISTSSAHMTDAQRRVKEKQRQLEERQLKKLAAKPYRERIEEYNEKLSKLTEHNDIPRVSAAGNG